MMLEQFEFAGSSVTRKLWIGESLTSSLIPHAAAEPDVCAVNAWDQAALRGAVAKVLSGGGRGRLRIVDLFAGAGGLSLGVTQGLRAAGYDPLVELAADLDGDALRIYDRNLAPLEVHHGDVAQLVDMEIGISKGSAYFKRTPWIRDRRLAARLSGVDILIGGPPCQGHSNLNNHTRRFDLRNELYLMMPAVAIVLNTPIVIIENVREVKADHHRVVEQTIQLLTSSGYSITEGVFSAIELGLPQTRNRFFLIAVKGTRAPRVMPLEELTPLARPRRDLRWAMADLENCAFGGIHRPAALSIENQRRINWLFDNNEVNLPDHERPDCHKNGHTYGAVYGRLEWHKPSGTITTGFLTPGRGRYVHPSQRRALTPHEAARIQGFPDSFQFTYEDGAIPVNKTLGKVIGDAVPPVMGQAAILTALQMRCHDLAAQDVEIAA